MNNKFKRTAKKCIAGVLAVSLAGSVVYYNGSLKSEAQEKATLPGIENIVSRYTSTDDAYNILEIVPDKSAASIGFLIAGQEPVSDGRKLSEIPSKDEREQAMKALKENLSGYNLGSALNIADYTESDNGGNSFTVRGRFVEDADGEYKYSMASSSYRMLNENETASGQRFNRNSAFTAVVNGTGANISGQRVNVGFSPIPTDGTGYLEVIIDNEKSNAASRYYLRSETQFTQINSGDFIDADGNDKSGNYAGAVLYSKNTNGSSASYSYYGYTVKGNDIEMSGVGYVSGGDIVDSLNPSESEETTETSTASAEEAAETAEAVETVIPEQADLSKSIYIVLPDAEPLCWMYYVTDKDGNFYYMKNPNLTDISSVYVPEFVESVNGDMYISSATYNDDGFFVMTDTYVPSDVGMYVMDGEEYMEVLWKGGMDAEAFAADTRKACKFIPAAAGETGDDIVEYTVKYDGGFDNAEWFKTNVLDLTESECANVNVKVTTMTLSELCDLVQNPDKASEYGLSLADADLVYLSGRGDYNKVLSDTKVSAGLEETILKLTQMAYGVDNGTVNINNRIPFVIDYDFVSKTTNSGLAVMALYMLQAENENIATDELAGYKSGKSFLENNSYDYVSGLVNALLAEKLGSSDIKLNDVKEFMAGNVYLCKNFIASTSFTAVKNDDVSKKLYADVAENAAYENFLRTQNNASGSINEDITDATIVRYVISWTSKRVSLKSKLNVLDVEPGGSYDDDIVLQTNIISYINQPDYDKKNIKITHMASAEFIGKIEDLNATYDLIYFGDNLEQFNTVYDNEKGIDIPVYNDTSMKGLVYTHTGDVYTYNEGDESDADLTRLQNDSLSYTKGSYIEHWVNPYNPREQGDNTIEYNSYQYRGTSNDINSTRCEELIDYIEAGYAVVFADRYFKDADGDNVSVDTYAVDSNSYYYKVMEFALSKDADGNFLYWNKNVFTESNLNDETLSSDTSSSAAEKKIAQQARQETFKKYLNLSKLSIQWESVGGEASKPTEYEYTVNGYEYDYDSDEKEYTVTAIDSTAKMLESDELTYIFSLQSDEAVSVDAVTYDCKLFVDSNADGRFAGEDISIVLSDSSSTEELDNIYVYEYTGDSWNRVEKTDGHFTLTIGKTYKVSRKIPDDYAGALPWKLVIYNNNNTGIRVSESGYTAIKRAETKKIKILQLTSDREVYQVVKDKNGNSVKDDNGNSVKAWVNKNYWNLTTDKNDADYDPEVSALLDEVKRIVGFDIEIDSMPVSDLLGEIRKTQSSWGQIYLKYGNESDYITYCRNNAASKFNQYDMLIIGFGDNYELGSTRDDDWCQSLQKGNQAVAEAIKDYIDSGKSVLFTHDTSSYLESTAGSGNSWYWGYNFNKTLRATLGLDRYGVSKLYYQKMIDENQSNADLKSYYQKSYDILNSYEYDTIYEPNTNTELGRLEGLTRYTTVRFLSSHLRRLISTKGESAALSRDGDTFYFPVKNSLLYNAVYKVDSDASATSQALFGTYSYSGASSLKVSQVNAGQITSYPYGIPDDMTIAATHYQWLQPNMELDKDNDGKSDIVVWYCLSDLSTSAANKKMDKEGITENVNIYNLVNNDVVNNYYIYTMGNVTYSGVGHSTPRKLIDSSGNATYEKRLFINTMVAAYKQGNTAPSLSFVDDAGNKTDGIYVMFDSENGIALNTGSGTNAFSVDFIADDNNVIPSKDIRVEFFKVADESDTDAITVTGIGQKVVSITDKVTVKKLSDNTEASKKTVAAGNYSDDVNNMYAGLTYYSVSNGEEYVLSFDADELGIFETKDGQMSIVNGAGGSIVYARITTVYNNGSDKTDSTIADLSVYPATLFELN